MMLTRTATVTRGTGFIRVSKKHMIASCQDVEIDWPIGACHISIFSTIALTPLHSFHYFRLYFAVLDTTGNVCSGVEVSLTAVPNGCGCQPSETEPCTYESNPTDDNRCFICDADDLLSDGGDCDDCKTCLITECTGTGTDTVSVFGNCTSSITTTDAMANCLDNAGPAECREKCSSACTKT